MLESDLVRLDAPVAADAARVFEYCQDPSFERYLTVPWPYQFEHAEGFLAEYVPGGWASDTEYTWALRAPGWKSAELLGVIGLRLLGPSVDEQAGVLQLGSVGFWLGAPFRGQGLIGEAQRLVFDWAFGTGLVDAVHWECIRGNTASARAAWKAGFSYAGVAPSVAAYRDGTHPLSWQGQLRAGDDRGRRPGWPAEALTEALSA
ncbi:GNAT family N-acetyltransferase [Cryobacterium melibiosiphilum]|uniref:GNAT family N-acetyltransferase n=1 Tax=Cryobacterium melibiosiphilum TaxID=995039 RepID=UPI001314FFE6|nr:GNAT family N-acetyltransferase [Cryobacterium melibiosiphilum]